MFPSRYLILSVGKEEELVQKAKKEREKWEWLGRVKVRVASA